METFLEQSNSNSFGTSLNAGLKAFLKSIALLTVGLYRSIGVAFFGGACRFEPSCSKYAEEALHQHDTPYALRLIVKRVLSCRPGGPSGFDPVPESKYGRR